MGEEGESMPDSTCMYIYIYIYIHIHTHITVEHSMLYCIIVYCSVSYDLCIYIYI